MVDQPPKFWSFLGCHGNNSANNILAPPNPTKENNTNSSNSSINGYGGGGGSGSNTNNLDSTTLNVTLGSEMKSITVPKSSTYKDMISTIKDKFGVNSKSTLCIKCENKDGEMFSLASDCHVKKAYNQQPENQPKELRLVVKEIPQKKCDMFHNSILSFFSNCSSSSSNTIAQNYTSTQPPPASQSSLQHLATQPVPDYLKPSNSNNKSDFTPPTSSSPSYLTSNNNNNNNNNNINNNVINNNINNNNNNNINNNINNNNNNNNNNNLNSNIGTSTNNTNNINLRFSLFQMSNSSTNNISNIKNMGINQNINNSLNRGFFAKNNQTSLCVGSHNSIHNTNNINNNKISTSPKQSNILPPINTKSNNNNNNNNGINNINNNLSPSQQHQQHQPQQKLNTTLQHITSNPQLNMSTSSFMTSASMNSNIESDTETMKRNESFDFNMVMEDDGSEPQSQPQSYQQNQSIINNDTCVLLNQNLNDEVEFGDEQQQQEKQKIINNGKPPTSTPMCREVGSFIQDTTKLFYKLRQTSDPKEMSAIKELICEKIQDSLTTMPWLLGFFPQLKQFANQSCPVFNVPPNTPPPSPLMTSPLMEMYQNPTSTFKPSSTSSLSSSTSSTTTTTTTKTSSTVNQASVYQVSPNVNINSIQSQLQLQNKIEVDMISKAYQESKKNQKIINEQQQQPQQRPTDFSSQQSSANTTTDEDSSCSNSNNNNNNSKHFLKIAGPTIHKGTTCAFCKFSPIIGNIYECNSCSYAFCELCKTDSALQCPSNDPTHKVQMSSLSKQCKKLLKSKASQTGSSSVSASPNRGCPYKRKHPKPTFGVKFLNDITLLFGSEVHPNECIVKTWRLLNTGPTLKDCLLVRVCGNTRLSKVPAILIPIVSSGEEFSLSVPIQIPLIPNKCEEYLVGEYWRICTSDGVYFGDQLWISLVVKNREIISLSDQFNKLSSQCNSTSQQNQQQLQQQQQTTTTTSTSCTCRNNNLISCNCQVNKNSTNFNSCLN
ncbi:hypothetical protein ACTFIR_010394 [Dictyostelium discoideum]